MTHLAEERLMAVRDGADDLEASTHLRECAECRRELEALSERRESVAEALGTLDAPWDLEASRDGLRSRIQEAWAESEGQKTRARGPIRFPDAPVRRRHTVGWALSRAAGLLLVTSVAAYALPGSPVRGWVDGAIQSVRQRDTFVSPPAPAPPDESIDTEATGIRLDVKTGQLRVVLQDAAPGTEIQVQWVPGTESAVFAPVGSRFTSAQGRIEARVTPGPVSVELPRGVNSVVLQVGDRTFLRKSEAGVNVIEAPLTRSDDGFVFRIPQP